MKRMKTMIRYLVGLVLLAGSTASQSTGVVLPPDVSFFIYTSTTQGLANLAYSGEGGNIFYFVLQEGLIQRFFAKPGPGYFLDLRDITTASGEQGLTSVAFHPDYLNNGRFYVSFTADGLAGVPVGSTAIAEYQVDPTRSDRADPNSRRVLLTIRQDFANNNGGHLAFGPDGYLYIAMGDGGGDNDPCDRAQTLDPANLQMGGGCADDRSTALLGKMLRIDVDRTTPAGSNELCGANPDGSAEYAVPNDNPFATTDNACDEVWAYGLHNPRRFSFDRETGDLWIGDAGQNIWEEINLETAGSGGGLNYGWPECEGAHPLGNGNAKTVCDFPSVPPVMEYNRFATGDCAVIGGVRYRGPILSLRETYVFGDACSNTVWFAQETSPGNFEFAPWGESMFGNITSFGEDPDGNLFISNSNGRVRRFTGFTTDVLFETGFEQLGVR